MEDAATAEVVTRGVESGDDGSRASVWKWVGGKAVKFHGAAQPSRPTALIRAQRALHIQRARSSQLEHVSVLYDAAAAWQFLQAHVPSPVISAVCSRWEGGDWHVGVAVGGVQAVLEVARAVDSIRPRVLGGLMGAGREVEGRQRAKDRA